MTFRRYHTLRHSSKMKQPEPRQSGAGAAKNPAPVFTLSDSDTSMGWNVEDDDVRDEQTTENADPKTVTSIYDRVREAARKAGALAKIHAWSDDLRENARLAREVILAHIDEVTECMIMEDMRTSYVPESCEPLEAYQVKSVTADPVIVMLQEIVCMNWDPVAVRRGILRATTIKVPDDVYIWKAEEVTPVITAAVHVATRNYGHCYDVCVLWHAERPRPMLCIVQRKFIPVDDE